MYFKSILALFLLIFLSYYIIYYQKHLYCYKIKKDDIFGLNTSDYYHVHSPLSTLIGLWDKQIDVGHNLDNYDLEFNNTGMEEEFFVDIYDSEKNRIYHFFCPEYLYFTTENIANSYILEKDKKYSIFLYSAKKEYSFNFRYCKQKSNKSITLYENIITVDESNNITNFYNFYYKFVHLFEKKGQRVIKRYDSKERKSWPNSGINFHLLFNAPEESKILILATNKSKYGIYQNIEINTEEENVLYPVNDHNNFWYLIIENDINDNKIEILERNYNIDKDSKLINFIVAIIC